MFTTDHQTASAKFTGSRDESLKIRWERLGTWASLQNRTSSTFCSVKQQPLRAQNLGEKLQEMSDGIWDLTT